MPSEEIRDTLLKAHNEMTKRGWHQGAMYSSFKSRDAMDMRQGKVCAVGAINAVTCLKYDLSGWFDRDEEAQNAALELESKARTHLRDYLRATYGYDAPTVPEWNDSVERTAEDVLLALKSAAEWDADE